MSTTNATSSTYFTKSSISYNSSNITPFLFKDESCRIYSASSNDTIMKDYEGIPENLLINVSVWLGAMIIFTFIRRIGNYGRFGLINIVINKDDEKYIFL